MADPLYELLAPHLHKSISSASSTAQPTASGEDPTTTGYLARLSTLTLSALNSTEPQSLTRASQSSLVAIQGLSTRSHKAIIASSDNLSTLRTTLPILAGEASKLQDAIPKLDQEALRFSQAYNRTAETPLLDKRRKAMLLHRNIDRLSDIMELPTLLSTAISSSSLSNTTASNSSSSLAPTVNYASALDLDGHIKRLHTLYPDSPLIQSVSKQAEQAMQGMASNLITNLRAPGIKLAAGMRAVEWLRRIAPDLGAPGTSDLDGTRKGGLEAVFLWSRLSNLHSMLEALEPLRDLADQEGERRKQNGAKHKATEPNQSWSGGHQTERYLKRYIEIFREQTFGIISMFKSIFPQSPLGWQGLSNRHEKTDRKPLDPFQPLPSALATFPLHLIELLTRTLRNYMPNVRDKASRESLLTQVLYCAGSLGRLGGDFTMLLATLEEEQNSDEEGAEETLKTDIAGKAEDSEQSATAEILALPEWVEVTQKHRILAGRLELLAGGGGASPGFVEAG